MDFSTLGRGKNFLRFYSGVVKTSDLTMLSIESSLARKLTYKPLIHSFTEKKRVKLFYNFVILKNIFLNFQFSDLPERQFLK